MDENERVIRHVETQLEDLIKQIDKRENEAQDSRHRMANALASTQAVTARIEERQRIAEEHARERQRTADDRAEKLAILVEKKAAGLEPRMVKVENFVDQETKSRSDRTLYRRWLFGVTLTTFGLVASNPGGIFSGLFKWVGFIIGGTTR